MYYKLCNKNNLNERKKCLRIYEKKSGSKEKIAA